MIKSASASREPLQQSIIAAIEIGTTHAGYATAHIADIDDIKIRYTWPYHPTPSPKTLSAIRYKIESFGPIVESWGYSARRNHINRGSDNTYKYFDRLGLYLDEDAVQKLPELPSDFTALNIIADYLHCLYLKAFEDIQSCWGVHIRPENVIWCLTVPAMSSEKVKQDMREAAVIAGLVSPQEINNRNRLNIVLEPAAAAMCCYRQPNGCLLEPGDTFMIVDVGNETIDLSVIEIFYDPLTETESLHEITFKRGRCESTLIDEAFILFVKVKCGSNNVDNFRASHPASWLSLMKEWEEIKREFEGDGNYEQVIFLPPRLRQLMDDDDDDDLTITSKDCFSMFDPMVNRTLELVELQLERSCRALAIYRKSSDRDTMACKIDKMFFVGESANNEYLWKKAIERFGSRVVLYRLSNPSSVVLKGAVLCGKYSR